MRWISADEVYTRLPRLAAIDRVRAALEGEREQTAASGPRVSVDEATLRLLLMPARAAGVVGFKAITFAESNPKRGLPTIQGLVALFDANDGHLIGACDGPALTAVRTAAIAGYATERLARTDSDTMLLAGAGAQAPFQVAAVAAIRPISRVLLWNRTAAKAEDLARTLALWNSEIAYQPITDLGGGCRQADVITLVTGATEPLIHLADTKPDCHVNAMGSYQPDRREVASDLVRASVVFADTLAGCQHEAGDLLIPASAGEVDWADVLPLAAADPRFRHQRTLLKSVGSAIFDLACARALFDLRANSPSDVERGIRPPAEWPIKAASETDGQISTAGSPPWRADS